MPDSIQNEEGLIPLALYHAEIELVRACAEADIEQAATRAREEARVRVEQLEKQVEELAADLALRVEEIAAAREQVQALDAERTQLAAEGAARGGELAAAQAAAEQARRDADAARTVGEELRRQLDAARAGEAEIVAQLRAEVEAAHAAGTNAAAQFRADLEAAHEEHARAAAQLQQEVAGQVARRNEAEAAAAALRSDEAALSLECNRLTAELSTLGQAVEAARAGEAENVTRLRDALEAACEEHGRAMAELREQVASHVARRGEIEQALAAQRTETESRACERDRLQGDVAGLRRELEAARADDATAVTQLRADIDAQRAAHAAATARLQQQITEQRDARAAAEKMVGDLRAQGSADAKSRRELESALEEATAELERLRARAATEARRLTEVAAAALEDERARLRAAAEERVREEIARVRDMGASARTERQVVFDASDAYTPASVERGRRWSVPMVAGAAAVVCLASLGGYLAGSRLNAPAAAAVASATPSVAGPAPSATAPPPPSRDARSRASASSTASRAAAVVAAADTGGAPPATGYLRIVGDDGLEVVVDGTRVGVTPLAELPVAAGRRDVVVRDAQGGEARYFVDARPGRATAVAVRLDTAPAPQGVAALPPIAAPMRIGP